LQIARRGIIGGIEQHGGDKQGQGQLGIEGDRRCSGYQREPGTGERQERGVGDADAIGPQREHCAEQQQSDD